MKYICTFLTVLVCSLFSGAIDLGRYERSLYSQNGEDGILSKLFQLIDPVSKFGVELGAYDGITGSNTYLFRLQGWKALLLDRQFELPEINLHKAFITAENINELFEKYKVPFDLDLLSIDIDYNDFYIWNAIDEKYKPSVVVIEYNASHLPDQDKVAKYRPYYVGDDTNYYGASILALYRLGRSKGYSLVYADQNGVNLFFVRDDLIASEGLVFKDVNDVQKIYRFPTYGKGPNGGHPYDYKMREYLTSNQIIGRL